ncbi:hypothetical protein BZM26_37705 [Paraburkholderia strydomiana]|nr:hypothetical protein BZM26_37705 [Paraburkholderia strydomiana]
MTATLKVEIRVRLLRAVRLLGKYVTVNAPMIFQIYNATIKRHSPYHFDLKIRLVWMAVFLPVITQFEEKTDFRVDHLALMRMQPLLSRTGQGNPSAAFHRIVFAPTVFEIPLRCDEGISGRLSLFQFQE